MRINLTDLELFTWIAETGSITAGARRMHLALASASERVQGMELALGVSLLRRERRGVSLTPAGQALLHHARLVAQQIDRLRGEIGEFSAGLRGRIRLLCNTSALTEYLPEVLGEYLAEHPNLDVELEEKPSHQIVPALLSGIADLGIVADSVDLGQLQTYPLRPDRLVLVCPPGHPLSAADGATFEQVLDWPMIGLTEGSGLHEHLAGHAAFLRRTIGYRVRLRSFEAIFAMVARGVGVAIGPISAARRAAHVTPLAIVELTDAWASRQLMLCVRRRVDLPLPVSQLVDRLLRAA